MSAAVQQLQVYSVAAYFGVARLALQTGLAPLEDFAAYPSAVKPIVLAHASQTRYYSTQHDELAALQESAAQVRAARQASPSYGKLPLIVLSQDDSQDQSAQGKQDGSHVGRLTAGSGLAFFQQSAQRCPAQWALHSPGSTRSRHRGYPVGLATGTVVEAQQRSRRSVRSRRRRLRACAILTRPRCGGRRSSLPSCIHQRGTCDDETDSAGC